MDRVLLVVDDDPDVGELFIRFLKRRFGEICLARSLNEAESVLQAKAVTHLVTDELLSLETPSPTASLARWRRERPSIQYAAVFSGRARAPQAARPAGADDVFCKPQGFDALMERLAAER